MQMFRHGWILAAFAVLATTGVHADAVPALAAQEEASVDRSIPRGQAYAHLMRSLFAARRGEFRAAAGEVKRAIEVQPDSPAVRVQGARLLQRMGRSAEAEQRVREALAIDANHGEALRLLADMVGARVLTSPRPSPEARAEALSLYTRLRQMGIEDEQILKSMAGLSLQAGDRPRALEFARRLVELNPGDRRATASLAQLLLEEGRDSEALDTVLRYVARHPDDEGLVNLADELARQLDAWGHVEAALLEHGEFGNRATPADRLLGEAQIQLGKIDEAVEALERATRARPEDRDLRYRLVGAYRALGRLADGAVVARALAVEQPDDGRAHFVTAEILEAQGDHDASLQHLAAALELFSAAEESHAGVRDAILERMALIHLREENPMQARLVLAELSDPDQPEALELLARLEIAIEDWSAARQAVRRLRSAGGGAIASLLEGELLARSGKLAKAEPKFAEAVDALGSFTRETIAQIYLDLGRDAEAESVMREWVAGEPEHPDAHFYLGYLLFRLDRFEEAELSLREAFRLDSRHAASLNFLGYTLAERNERLDEALDLVRRALEVEGWNGAFLDSLGWVYYRLGRFEEAQDPLERAAREYPKDSTVLEHLGDLYSRLGEKELAIEAWSRALEEVPEDAAALTVKIVEARRSVAEPQALAAPSADTENGPPMRP